MDKEKDITVSATEAKKTETVLTDRAGFSGGHGYGSDMQNNKQTESREVFLGTLRKKTDKLVTALYVVTDCMDHDEPIRQTLRMLGVNLIKETCRLGKGTTGASVVVFRDAEEVISEIASFLDIARSLGFVSDMNASILADEFAKLSSHAEQYARSMQNASMFSPVLLSEKAARFALPDFNDDDADPVSDIKMKEGTSVSFMKPESDRAVRPSLSSPRQDMPIADKKDIFKKQPSSEERSASVHAKPKQSPVSTASSGASSKEDRKDTIIRMIRQKGEIAIKDIADVIVGCSEKTIQRELVAMVESGVLKKTGEKRWSRYSLK